MGRRTPLRQLIREDLDTNRGARLSPGFHALVVYRFGQAVLSLPPVWRVPLWRIYRWAYAAVTAVYGVELPHSCSIGRRLRMPHPHGVVLVAGCVVGDDCRFRHNVTIGEGSSQGGGWPTLGDRVDIGPGAIVMGAVHIGDDVVIGPNAVVIDDVPAGMRVLAPPAAVRRPRSRSAHAEAHRAQRQEAPSDDAAGQQPDEPPAGRPGSTPGGV